MKGVFKENALSSNDQIDLTEVVDHFKNSNDGKLDLD